MTEYEETDGLTLRDFKNIAKEYILLFFCKDNTLDKEALLTNRNVSLVLNLDICSGLPLIYDAVTSNAEFKTKKKTKVSPDISFVLSMLNKCAKLMIPKCFAVGLIAIYLETVKGCKVNYERS